MNVPSALLKKGENVIEILELGNVDLNNIESVAEPIGNVKGEI